MALDKGNMLEAIKSFPQQCKEALSLTKGLSVPGETRNVVICGMGGSAMGGDLLKAYMSSANVPVHVNRGYKVPGFVNDKSLVFAVSYSGNTEETLSSYFDAHQRNAKIIGISSGGKLAEECSRLIKIPAGMQPRAALGYLFFPMLGVLHNANLVRVRNEELNEMFEILKKNEKPMAEAEALAKKLKDKIPLIYSSEQLYPVAMRWKTQINENAKMAAFWNVFPEMNHNEIAAYQSMDSKYAPVFIRDRNDNERVRKRMDICKEIMEKRMPVHEVYTQGSSLLARMFSAIHLGDFVSYHLALWNRVDPNPVYIIEDMKKKLGNMFSTD